MKDKKLFITSIIFFLLYLIFLIGIFTPLREIFMPIITAIAFVYFLSPLVKRMQKYRIHPAISVSVIYALIVVLLIFSVFFAIPAVSEGVEKVWSIIDSFIKKSNTNTKDIVSMGAEKAYLTAMSAIKTGMVFFVGAVSAFYVLTGKDKIKKSIKEFIPLELIKYFKILLDDIKASLDSFFKGQVLIALILFLIDAIFLFVMKVPYAVGLGAIAAVLDIIPYAGAIIGVGIILLVTFLSVPEKLIWVFIGLLIIQQIENNIISPKISSDTLSLHPSVTIIVLYIGAFGGFWGILLAVPLTSIFCKICRRFIQSIM